MVFNAECDKLSSIFSRLIYPRGYIESVISKFSLRDLSDPSANVAERELGLPFKDQVSANSVRRHLRDLRYKIGPAVQPVFVSGKLERDFRPKEVKPSVVNQQCLVCHFSCGFIMFLSNVLSQLFIVQYVQ